MFLFNVLHKYVSVASVIKYFSLFPKGEKTHKSLIKLVRKLPASKKGGGGTTALVSVCMAVPAMFKILKFIIQFKWVYTF